MGLTNRIFYLKVSSIVNLINTVEHLVAEINTAALYENDSDSFRKLQYHTIIAKIKSFCIGNLAKEVRDIDSLQEVKKILYDYASYEQGNFQPNQFRFTDQRSHNLRNFQSNQFRYTDQRSHNLRNFQSKQGRFTATLF